MDFVIGVGVELVILRIIEVPGHHQSRALGKKTRLGELVGQLPIEAVGTYAQNHFSAPAFAPQQVFESFTAKMHMREKI